MPYVQLWVGIIGTAAGQVVSPGGCNGAMPSSEGFGSNEFLLRAVPVFVACTFSRCTWLFVHQRCRKGSIGGG